MSAELSPQPEPGQGLTPEALQREVEQVLAAYNALLQSPAYAHDVDLAVLTKLATDERTPARERRQAAEVLLRYRVRLLDRLAELTGAREQVLKQLGLESQAPGSVNVTQVNNVVEIVRSSDWRSTKLLPGHDDG